MKFLISYTQISPIAGSVSFCLQPALYISSRYIRSSNTASLTTSSDAKIEKTNLLFLESIEGLSVCCFLHPPKAACSEAKMPRGSSCAKRAVAAGATAVALGTPGVEGHLRGEPARVSGGQSREYPLTAEGNVVKSQKNIAGTQDNVIGAQMQGPEKGNSFLEERSAEQQAQEFVKKMEALYPKIGQQFYGDEVAGSIQKSSAKSQLGAMLTLRKERPVSYVYFILSTAAALGAPILCSGAIWASDPSLPSI